MSILYRFSIVKNELRNVIRRRKSNAHFPTLRHGKMDRRFPTAGVSFQQLKRAYRTSSHRLSTPCTIKVFDWNVLAPDFAYSFRYTNLSEHLLKWTSRCPAIIAKILEYDPDIITLQEVTDATFRDICKGLPEFIGYFAKKSNESIDGSATFWKRERFQIVELEVVPFHKNQFLNKPQIALLVLLYDLKKAQSSVKSAHDSSHILVTNTHLIFNETRGDIKLAQTTVMIQAVWTLLKKYTRKTASCLTLPLLSELKEFKNHSDSLQFFDKSESIAFLDFPALVMCGDFNLTPASDLFDWIWLGSHDFEAKNNDAGCREISGQQLMKKQVFPQTESDCHKNFSMPSTELDTKDDANLQNYNCSFCPQKATRSLPSSNEANLAAAAASTSLQEENSDCSSNMRSTWFQKMLSSIEEPSLFTQPRVMWVQYKTLMKAMEVTQMKHTSVHTSPKGVSDPEVISQSDSSKCSISCMLYHPLFLQSSFVKASSFSERLQRKIHDFTAFHSWQKGCIDYIWFSGDTLDVSKVTNLPSSSQLISFQDVPNKNFPMSDHFFLNAELKWKHPSDKFIPVLLPASPMLDPKLYRRIIH